MEPQHGTFSRYSSKRFNCRCALCRAAATEYQRQRRLARADVREKDRLHSARRNLAVRMHIAKLKNKPCTDCGVEYPSYVMQFDHLDGTTKEFQIAHMNTIAKIDIEAAKCEVVCANCHAERTYRRRMVK